MRIVVALGGNALLKRGEPTDMRTQARNVARAARSIAEISAGNELVVTHGNGPQIGLLALRSAAAAEASSLDVLGAETEGMIGYLLERELMNALGHSRVVTLLTETEVDRSDPAFATPTKFIGPVYSESEARQVAAAQGWAVARDGQRWRRVVASPQPLHILQTQAVEHLLRGGFVVICAGGGGIPVARSPEGMLEGVECVIDKDFTAAHLGASIGADCLAMLTDVDAVYGDWGTPTARRLRAAHPRALRTLSFPAGSMGPKVEAGCRFAGASGRQAFIGALENVGRVLRGESGTRIATDIGSLVWDRASQG